MKKFIVVTGGSGFVGTNLIKYLVKKSKYNIISLDEAEFRLLTKQKDEDLTKLIKNNLKIFRNFKFGIVTQGKKGAHIIFKNKIIFIPSIFKPKIDSTLLFFNPKKDYIKIKNPNNLEKVTRIFFNQRRKMLKKPFNQLFNGDKKILDKLKINLNLRPQNINYETYYKLVCEYENLGN